jgi:choline-glycine betaine transporter
MPIVVAIITFITVVVGISFVVSGMSDISAIIIQIALLCAIVVGCSTWIVQTIEKNFSSKDKS